MSSVQASSDCAGTGSTAAVDMKLEVVVIPVSDVDRAKEFYGGLGWRLDADVAAGDDFRIVQFTPPGSGCSIQFGKGLTSAAPGSAQDLYLIVSDIEAARDELAARGVEVSEVFHEGKPGGRFHDADASARVSGPAPDGSYRLVRDVQRPGRQRLAAPGDHDAAARPDRPGATTFASASDLAQALRRAAAAHGEHEKRTGEADENWPDWYAEYMVREQAGEELPT